MARVWTIVHWRMDYRGVALQGMEYGGGGGVALWGMEYGGVALWGMEYGGVALWGMEYGGCSTVGLVWQCGIWNMEEWHHRWG